MISVAAVPPPPLTTAKTKTRKLFRTKARAEAARKKQKALQVFNIIPLTCWLMAWQLVGQKKEKKSGCQRPATAAFEINLVKNKEKCLRRAPRGCWYGRLLEKGVGDGVLFTCHIE